MKRRMLRLLIVVLFGLVLTPVLTVAVTPQVAHAETIPSIPGIPDPCKLPIADPVLGSACATTHDVAGDCKQVPTPESPETTFAANSLGITRAGHLPPNADPFSAQPSTTVYAQYGFAGPDVGTYDLGCAGAKTDWQATAGTWFANLGSSVTTVIVSLGAMMNSLVLHPDSWSSFLDGPIVAGNKLLTDNIWWPAFAVILAALGVWLIKTAGERRNTQQAELAGAALLVVVATSALAQYPLWAGHQFDHGIVWSVNATNEPFAGQTGYSKDDPHEDAVTANIHNAFIYETWVKEELGSTGTPTAIKYGPMLWKDHALTWREAHLPAKERSKVIKAKQDDWKKVASKIQDEDPDAYGHLAGHRWTNRVESTWLSVPAALISVVFTSIADFIIFIAMLAWRLLVMLWPVIALFALLPQYRKQCVDLAKWVLSCGVAGVKFCAGAGAYAMLVGSVLNPSHHLNPFVMIVFLLAISYALWRLLKPSTAFWSMLPGNPDSLRSYQRQYRTRKRRLRQDFDPDDGKSWGHRQVGRRLRRRGKKTPKPGGGKPSTKPTSTPTAASGPSGGKSGRSAGKPQFTPSPSPAAAGKPGLPRPGPAPPRGEPKGSLPTPTGDRRRVPGVHKITNMGDRS